MQHQLLAYEMEEISTTIQQEKEAKATKWSALISTPGNRRRTLIAICVGGFAQWNVSQSNPPLLPVAS